MKINSFAVFFGGEQSSTELINSQLYTHLIKSDKFRNIEIISNRCYIVKLVDEVEAEINSDEETEFYKIALDIRSSITKEMNLYFITEDQYRERATSIKKTIAKFLKQA